MQRFYICDLDCTAKFNNICKKSHTLKKIAFLSQDYQLWKFPLEVGYSLGEMLRNTSIDCLEPGSIVIVFHLVKLPRSDTHFSFIRANFDSRAVIFRINWKTRE